MPEKILVAGSIAYDILLGFEGSFADTIKSENIEDLSVSYFVPHFVRQFGGCGANIAFNLNMLGGDPVLVGAVGNDGVDYISLMRESGIDVSNIETHPDHVTATAVIGTDSGERQISFFHPGADAHVPWPDLPKGDISMGIVSPRDLPAMIAAIDWCDKNEVPVFFDPGQQIHMFGPDEMKRLVNASHGVIVNEYEWGIMKEKLSCTEENFAIYNALLIVTQGEDGVVYYDERGAQHVPLCSASNVVNPTGAGDAFRSGMLFGLQSGWSLLDACRLGAAMGSFAVEIDGTLLTDVKREDVWARANETYDGKLPE